MSNTRTNQNPEQIARDHIDTQLVNAGWLVQAKNKIDLHAGKGVAIREEEGQHLTQVEEQSAGYANSKLKYLNNDPLPFVYESTGVLTRFTDYRDPKPRSRLLFHFHQPDTLSDWLKQAKTLRTRLQHFPALDEEGLRPAQIKAINNLEQSLLGGKDGRKPAKPRKLKNLEDKVLSLPPYDIPTYLWKWSYLGNVVKKVSDGPFGSNLKTADYVDNGIRVIRLENIKSLFFDNSKKTYITKEKYKLLERHSVVPNDVVFSSFINENTSVASVPLEVSLSINKADCFCIKCGSSINHKYIEYFLSTRTTYNQLINLVHGATRPRINTTQLKKILLPLCSLKEQTQIVQAIESRLSVCDKLSETLTTQLEKAESLRQSILKKAFEGRLLSYAEIKACQQEADWEPAEQLLARIKAESAKKPVAKPRKKQTKKKAN